VTLNDREPHNGPYFVPFHPVVTFGANSVKITENSQDVCEKHADERFLAFCIVWFTTADMHFSPDFSRKLAHRHLLTELCHTVWLSQQQPSPCLMVRAGVAACFESAMATGAQAQCPWQVTLTSCWSMQTRVSNCSNTTTELGLPRQTVNWYASTLWHWPLNLWFSHFNYNNHVFGSTVLRAFTYAL